MRGIADVIDRNGFTGKTNFRNYVSVHLKDLLLKDEGMDTVFVTDRSGLVVDRNGLIVERNGFVVDRNGLVGEATPYSVFVVLSGLLDDSFVLFVANSFASVLQMENFTKESKAPTSTYAYVDDLVGMFRELFLNRPVGEIRIPEKFSKHESCIYEYLVTHGFAEY